MIKTQQILIIVNIWGVYRRETGEKQRLGGGLSYKSLDYSVGVW